ncbi:zinc finger protein 91 isoform X2 [Aedes aegypti]|uniref:C2H2-type domain-containing protein n=1 Tax=Aedes aegypti TaxID=7159 RepID=A0A6I8T557_AEDAE|nr:zinc finger protein 91 isoform X2 [Aedes aegypti]
MNDMVDIEEAKIETRIIGVESSQSSATIRENQSSNEKQSISTPERNANTGSGKSHQCDICHKTYQTKKRLRQHIEVKHKLPYVFKCQQCEVSFRFEIQLRKHERSQQHLNKLQETKAQHKMPTKEEQIKVHICSICDRSFINGNALQLHVERHVPGECEVCHKTFQDRRKLKSHMKYHAPKTNACTICDKSFISKRTLIRHVESHDKKRERQEAIPSFKCDICQKMFLYEGTLTLHKRKAHGPKTYDCYVCGSHFSTSEQLGEHIKIHVKLSRIKMNEKQQLLQGDVKVKIEPREEAYSKIGQNEQIIELSSEAAVDLDSHIESVSPNLPSNNEQHLRKKSKGETRENEQSIGIEDMIDIEEVKIESRKDDDEELDTFTSSHASRTINKITSDTDQTNQNMKHASGDEQRPASRPIRKCKLGKATTETDNDEQPTPLECKVCHKTFRFNCRLNQHEAEAHGPRVHDCDICDASFRTRYGLVLHLDRHKKGKEAGFYSLQALQSDTSASLKNDIETESEHNSEKTSPKDQNITTSTSLQCAKCFKVWPNQNRLWLHYKSAHKEKLKCSLCSETFKFQKRLDRHMELQHKQEDGSFQPLKCAQCNKHFQTSVQYAKHTRIHGPKNHNCTMCSLSFRTTVLLKAHQRTHKFDGMIIDCEICNKVFTNHKQKALHMRAHEPKKHICHICNRQCAFRVNLLAHMKIHEKESCTIVKNPQPSSYIEDDSRENSGTSIHDDNSKHFETREEIHTESIHEIPIKTKKVKCQVTPMTASQEQVDSNKDTVKHKMDLSLVAETETTVENHRESDFRLELSTEDLPSNNEKEGCEQLTGLEDMIDIGEVKIETRPDDDDALKAFNNSTEAESSKPTQGKESASEVMPVQCNICNKILKSSKKWWHHNRRVHGPKKFECPICGRPCIDVHQLKTHIPTHQPIHERRQAKPITAKKNVERPFKCDICDKSFVRRCNVTHHKKQSHGPKPHCCDICDAKFSMRAFLRRHLLTHKPDPALLECKICNLTFPSVRKRSTHMTIHRPKQHKCPFCTKTCTLRINLYRHMKTHDEYHDTASPTSSVTELDTDGASEPSTLENEQSNHSTGVVQLKGSRSSTRGPKKRQETDKPTKSRRTHRKPHSCSVCSSKFSSKKKLKEHVLAEHQETLNDVTIS